MIIKTTPNNLQVGETVRLYLEISDLKDDSGNKIHLSEIRKVSIQKLNNNHLDPYANNVTIKNFYGYKNPRLKLNSSNSTTNFLVFLDNSGNRINFHTNTYYVKINAPEEISGYYKIIDVPTDGVDSNGDRYSRTFIISGIFADITQEIIDFQITDSEYNVISADNYNDSTLIFNASEESFSPLWKDNIFYFSDNNNYNFSLIGFNSITSSYDYYIDDCVLQISIDGSSYTSYNCSNLFKINESYSHSNSFFIKGFDNTNYNETQTYYWKLLDPDGNEISLLGSHIKNNGFIKQFYYTPVKFDTFTNSDNEILYRYYLDWTIEETLEGAEGSYLVYWHVRRNDDVPEEIYQKEYMVHDDYSITANYTKKFTRENYYQLLQKYIPFFYFDYEAADVLLETLKAFGESIYDVQYKVDKFLEIHDPERAPIRCLPYIANLFSFALKGTNPVQWRQQISQLPLILKKKGTLEGLTQILELIGTEIKSFISYWQVVSPYTWTDYFFLENSSETEKYDLTYSPILQITNDYYETYGSEILASTRSESGINFSRCKIEYYSQDKSTWYQLFPIYEDNILVHDFFSVVQYYSEQQSGKIKSYSKKLGWNFNDEFQNLYYITHVDLRGIFDSDFYNFIKDNKESSYSIHIKSGNVRLGTYNLSNEDIDWDYTESQPEILIEIRHYGELESLFLGRSISESITFDFLVNGEVHSTFSNLTGTLNVLDQTIKSVRDTQGKIKGYDLSTELISSFTPKKNDILKIRYQRKAYPYELNSSSSDYQVNFDNSELCKDDYILSLDLADSRNPYDSNYIDGKVIPLVNYNVRLLPDSNCYVQNEDTDLLECLSSYDICDICSKKNPLSDPIVYGHIRTKFPWSENVYNMDEYDGSTRPSYNPCDIDEDFLDKCGCCWSSYFSLSVEVLNISDNMLQTVRTTINEFKPFHSRIKNINFIGKFEDKVNIFDDYYDFLLKIKQRDILEIGYYPYDQVSNSFLRKKRSDSYFFASGNFKTSSTDLLDNVYLRDNNVAFNEFGIGVKADQSPEDVLPTLNINTGRVVITGPSSQSPHYNKVYNISEISSNKIKIIDATSDDGDSFPTLSSWSYEGPWDYTIYNRKYPSGVEQFRSAPATGNNDTVTVIKKGKFIINTSIDLFDYGIQIDSELTDSSNIYTVYIESGADYGSYNILKVTENQIEIDNYSYSGSYGNNITFSVYRDGEIIDDLQSVNGTLQRTEIYGIFDVSGSWDDFKSDWGIIPNDSYVYLDYNETYYPIHSIIGNTVTVSGYDTGVEGSVDIAIFEKVLSSSSGYIYPTTDIIHSENNSSQYTFDFYNMVHQFDVSQVNDFLVGLELNGKFEFYPVNEVYSGDHYKVKLDGLDIREEIDPAQEMRIRVYKLTNYKINDTVYPETVSTTDDSLVSLLEGTATGGSNNSLTDSSKNFEDLYVKENDIVIFRRINDTKLSYEDISGNITSGSNEFVTTESWNIDEYIGKQIYISSGNNQGIYNITSNSDTTLRVDRNFPDNSVGISAIIYTPINWEPENPNESYSWALVDSVSGDTITFKSIYSISGNTDELQQNGLTIGSFSSGDLYRIIRRNVYDYNLEVPKSDIVKIKIDPDIPDLLIPVENIMELSAPTEGVPYSGEYKVTISSEDTEQDVEIASLSSQRTEEVLVGPIDIIDPSFLPTPPLDRYRIIDKDPDNATGGFVNQFDFSIYNSLNIDKSNITVEVNGIVWEVVDSWTDPSSAPGLIGRRECIIRQLSINEIKIYFGDGITGKRVDPGDVINIIYGVSGYLPGPVAAEEITSNELAIFEIQNVDITSPNYGQKVSVRVK